MTENLQRLHNHLQTEGKTDSWLNLAKRFGILPEGTNKQRADKVRRIYSRNVKPIRDAFIPGITTTTYWIDRKGKAVYRSQPDLSETLPSRPLTEYEEFLEFKRNKKTGKTIAPFIGGNPDNVLVVGDLHLPFTKEGYLEFCREQQERFNCGTVIFIGDLLDNHAQSFHESDADGLSARDELLLAVGQLKRWYEVFPEAQVCLGNHDRIVARKLFSMGLSQRWMRPLGEVLETPNWKFVEQVYHNDVLYIHGEGGTARKKAHDEMVSCVQGHTHTDAYVELMNGGANFAMQVGCGIDFDTYAFAYAQRGKKPILSCGVVLDRSPILVPFHV